MKQPTLEDLVAQGILPDDKAFIAMLRASENSERCLVITNPVQQKIPYASESCKLILGYDAAIFSKGGFPFLQSITTPQTMPVVMQALFEFLEQLKNPGFDPRTILIKEFPFDVIQPGGAIKSIVSTALGLTYTSSSDLEYSLNFLTDPSPEILVTVHSLLTDFKSRHNEIYKHRPIANQAESLKKLNVLGAEPQKLTLREKEILKLMAEGFTSAQIASTLFIEENTVESHRKNLLSKFGAKNMAELIKKASKIYWLE